MASRGGVAAEEQGWSRRERPWLIPSNRKLRHLRGITLRNLALSQTSSRSRGKTIDDEALPYTLKSPAKILALREANSKLGHSRSSSDLRPIHESADTKGANGHAQSGKPRETGGRTPTRPTIGKLRRRSTMEWAAANPQQRQKRLDAVSANRMADIFYTLHVTGVEEPIYVSEVAERTMNPNFRHVDLGNCGPGITRSDSITVKFWVKSERVQEHQILLEMSLSLRSLQFIGKALAGFHHPFPPNCVVFELTDGFYTCFTEAQVEEPRDPFAGAQAKTQSTRVLPTSSFDALLRLSKLDDSVQDALSLRERLSADLNKLFQENKHLLAEKDRVGEAEDFLKTVNYARATVEKQLKVATRKRDEKRHELETRRKLLAKAREAKKHDEETVASGRSELNELRERHEQAKKHVTNQRRRICEDVQKVYPITPLPNRSLAFTIRNLHLPNSEDLDSEPAEVVSSALGHVAHTVQLLSFYLAIPLPYPVNPRSSTSTIQDPISLMQNLNNSVSAPNARTFPLFVKGAVRFRFEYGVFLLNKNIEILLSSKFGVRVLDIRQTLPNLLLALSCATAGEGELPARKAGGVRGLLRVRDAVHPMGTVKGGASMPRMGSSDSAGSGYWRNGKSREEEAGAVESLERNKEAQERKARGIASA